MASILGDYHRYGGSSELPTAEQFDVTYANLTNCDTATDIMVIESGGEPVGYVRTSWEQRDDDDRDYIIFSPTRPDHIRRELFEALVVAQEAHLRPMAAGVAAARFRAYAPHPGPGMEPTNESAWLESLGYEAVRFEASLVRPHLEDIPDLPLPDGVEVRAVTPEMLRAIFEAHHENFRGNWDFQEFSEEDFQRFLDDPHLSAAIVVVHLCLAQLVLLPTEYIRVNTLDAYDPASRTLSFKVTAGPSFIGPEAHVKLDLRPERIPCLVPGQKHRGCLRRRAQASGR